MSRIGRMPIAVPAGVTVDIAENNKVTVKGPKGTLERVLPADHVHKNQIIDQLHVFNFFLFFIVKKIHLEAVFSFHLI